MLPFVRGRAQDQDAQLHSTGASERGSRLHWASHRARAMQHNDVWRVVRVGGFRHVHPHITHLPRRAQDQDAQLHRWDRLSWVGHRASGLQQGGMLVGVGGVRLLLHILRLRRYE
jgi:hypothetical protein